MAADTICHTARKEGMAVVMWEEKEQGSSGAGSSGIPFWLGRWAQLQPFVFMSYSFEKNTDYFSRCRLAFPSVPNSITAQDASQAPHNKGWASFWRA